MKLEVLKTTNKIVSRNDKSLGIQTYGANNDFPQVIEKIVSASITGSSSVNVYSKFINGRGFENEELYNKVVNKKGQTLDIILRNISRDYAYFGGFALHINYNALGQIIEVQNIPFEQVRFEKLDDNNEFNKVALHWDWGRDFSDLRRWRKDDIDFIDLYNPNIDIIEQQAYSAGGWENYRGQVYYFTGDGELSYPLPSYFPALTDMNTEEGLSNIDNRNVRNRFMLGGMLVEIRNDNENTENEQEDNDTEKALLRFQGDSEACKIGYIEVGSKEEIPEFIPFQSENYDKQYTETNKNVKDRIGRALNQPPILRAEDIGAGFGSDLMVNAYKYYNIITEAERMDIERVFKQLFANWHEGHLSDNYSIISLKWEI